MVVGLAPLGSAIYHVRQRLSPYPGVRGAWAMQRLTGPWRSAQRHAAVHRRPQLHPTNPPGLQNALPALQGMPSGAWMRVASGLGLLGFALYSLAEARRKKNGRSHF